MNSNFQPNSSFFIKGALINIFLQFLAYFFTRFLGGPMIFITPENAQKAAIWVIFLAVFLILLSVSTAVFKKSFWPPRSARLEPSLAWPRLLFLLSIFALNIALGIFLRSWLMVLVSFLAYIFWRGGNEKFSAKYLAGKLRQKNKLVFYAFAGILAFIFIFIFLNFDAFWNRSVSWEKRRGKISYDEPSNIKIPLQFKSPGASYYSYASISQNIFAARSSGQPTILENQNYLLISKINVKAPIILAFGTSQKELNQALDQGIVLYPGSVSPGQNGEVFLTGHSSTYIWNRTPYGQIFSLLDKLEAGDIVSIFYQGQQYDYRVTSQEILSPSQTKISQTQNPVLALMTCWPPGTTLKRLVVRAELIK